MKAMVLKQLTDLSLNPAPLEFVELEPPVPDATSLLLRVSACGVCHTELDEIEGRTPPPRLPIIPGHQVVGEIIALGDRVSRFQPGARVGVAWIHSACGHCESCKSGQENLCPAFQATGRDVDGGYAEYMTVPEDFAYSIPAVFSASQAAPHLCAGAIGYRSLRLSGHRNGQHLGLTGFGASAHLVLMMIRHRYPESRISVFARSEAERVFARELGAVWAGDTTERPPHPLHQIIDTTPVWQPVIEALRCLRPGGRLVINAIRKEDADKGLLSGIDYPQHLWLEKEIKSVANVARRDVQEFLELAAEIPILPEIEEYPLQAANTALLELKQRKIRGAKVLTMT